MTSRQPTGFRDDINGLRAWAVLLVVLFHFRVPGFDGGFIGVDVFFVISGFLMTQIIVGGLLNGRFALPRFYLARALRIVPALAVLCLVLLLAGWFWLSAPEYRTLARQAGASIGFVSNLLFWSEAGYFDTASHDKWLLHTWSLAVEGQFYLAYPVVLLAVWRWRGGLAGVRPVVLGLAVLSLLACALVTPAQPSSAFFLLPTRGWQLLAGALVWLYADHLVFSDARRRWAEGLGIALIVASALVVGRDAYWPGLIALVPVLGTCLVLIAARQHSLLTGTALAQWLGSRSYSVYLWHWPVVVALAFLPDGAGTLFLVVGLALTIVLAELSFRHFERLPPSLIARTQARGRWAALLALVMSVAVSAGLVMALDGAPQRMPPGVELAAAESSNRLTGARRCLDAPGNPGTSCIYGGERTAAVLIGDSHGLSVASALAAAVPSPDNGVLAWIYPSCAPLFTAQPVPGVFRAGQDCPQFNRWIRDAIKAVPADVPIVLVSRTSTYVDGVTEHGQRGAQPPLQFDRIHAKPDPDYLRAFVDDLVASACALAQDRTVYLMRPIPEMQVDVPKTVSRAMAMGRQVFPTLSTADYNRRHAVVLAAQDRARDQCGIRILDPRPALCPDDRCVSVIDGRPLYYDDDHLSEHGNKLLVPMFLKVFNPSAP